jgi:hypothetical protein
LSACRKSDAVQRCGLIMPPEYQFTAARLACLRAVTYCLINKEIERPASPLH